MNNQGAEYAEVVKNAIFGDAEHATGVSVPEKRDMISSRQFEDVIVDQDKYGIRLTDTAEGRNSASMLVSRMYAWRGYAGTHVAGDDPNRITLIANNQGEVVGTLTIAFDSVVGLAADETFEAEMQAYRARGAKLCEFTKFAVDTNVRSKTSLANLFHLALIYARDIHHCTDIVIEVNPRHRRFYEHMLGFKREADVRINTRANAPAYLLRVNLDYVTEQIQLHGGTFQNGSSERSFYPHFFSPREEKGIISRLLLAEALPAN